MSLLEQVKLAEKMYDLGLLPIPLLQDRQKRPAVKWRELKENKPTREQVSGWFCQGARGFALLGGSVWGGLEALDFDNHETVGDEFKMWWEALPKTLTDRLPVIKTPGKAGAGWRIPWLFKEDHDWDSIQLAWRSEGEVSIEYHRARMLFVPGGFPNHHPSLKPYLWHKGGLENIPTLTKEERELCVRTARELSCWIPPPKPPKRGVESPKSDSAGGLSVWEDFNKRGQWCEILEPKGWTLCGRGGDKIEHWTRPGKSFGISATTGYGDEDLFYCFSASVTEIEPNKAHNKTATYAFLHHGGDFKEAIKALAALGYGKSERQQQTDREERCKEDYKEKYKVNFEERENDDLGSGENTQRVNEENEKPKNNRKFSAMSISDLMKCPDPEWLVDQHFHRGTFGVIFGQSGSYKSFYALDLALSVATGRKFLDRYKVTQGPVLYICGEGQGGMKRRAKAWIQEKGDGIQPTAEQFGLIGQRVDLTNKKSANLKELAECIALDLKSKPVLIIVDTLARSFSGDENSSEEMGKFIEVCDKLREDTAATVIPIHHTGKDSSRGARGSSALEAGCDSMFWIELASGGFKVENRKQKEMEKISDYILHSQKVIVEPDARNIGDRSSLVFNFAGTVKESVAETTVMTQAKCYTTIVEAVERGNINQTDIVEYVMAKGFKNERELRTRISNITNGPHDILLNPNNKAYKLGTSYQMKLESFLKNGPWR